MIRTANNRACSAFTLIELVVCMVIMVIFTAIAAPRYAQAIARYRVTVAARRLEGDIEWARALARTRSTSQAVVFDTSDSTYTLSGISNPDRPSQTYSVDLAANPYKATLSSVSFGGLTTLTFDGYGAPNASGSAVITCGSASKTVTVSADNGAVSIQ